jgi:hypothetical protein
VVKPEASTLSVQDIRESFVFLPHVYELLSAIEGNADVTEVTRVAYVLADKLKTAAALLEQIPGANCTAEEQQQLMEAKQRIFQEKTYVFFF